MNGTRASGIPIPKAEILLYWIMHISGTAQDHDNSSTNNLNKYTWLYQLKKFEYHLRDCITCKTNSPWLRSWATRTPIASGLKMKNSIPGLWCSRYCPRSLLKKWMLTSFCKSLSPFIFIPTSFLTALPAPSEPTTMRQWIFLVCFLPSLRKEAPTMTPQAVGVIDTHSWPIKIFLSPMLRLQGTWKPSHVWTWKLRFSSCFRSKLVSLYWEKCATETGLATCSKSGKTTVLSESYGHLASTTIANQASEEPLKHTWHA